MKTVWYQAEFYSRLSQCWVALGGRAHTQDEARVWYDQLVSYHPRRIVKVTQIKEAVSD